ncbi:hypothetical protein [Sorangium sp. So ce341]|uniref:hypothetical protein n=1 Tax=Sorangium sp. So ce341 TaxID=3133302 RepID=UPI003F61C5A7
MTRPAAPYIIRRSAALLDLGETSLRTTRAVARAGASPIGVGAWPGGAAPRDSPSLAALLRGPSMRCRLFPAVRQDEWLTAQLRTSRSVPSRPSWCPPRCAARRAAGSPFAGDPPILYAALAGRAIRGAITLNIVAVLRGEKAPDDALARELGAMGLL